MTNKQYKNPFMNPEAELFGVKIKDRAMALGSFFTTASIVYADMGATGIP